MIPKISSEKHYSSAHDRFLKPAIVNFFEREFCGMFGPVVRENIADALIDFYENDRAASFSDNLRTEKTKYAWSRMVEAVLGK